MTTQDQPHVMGAMATPGRLQKTEELRQMIEGALRSYDDRKGKTQALKACQWRFRGPNGEHVGLSRAGFKIVFCPEADAQTFDGRDNEISKLFWYERVLGPLTIEILPQITDRD